MKRETRWVALGYTVAVLLAYGESFHVYFLSDDFSLIAQAREGIFKITAAWYFRPTVAAYYAVHHALFGLWAPPYHLTLITLHVLNALLVRRILLRFALKEWSATGAGLLFAVAHPNHENLFWIAGATEIIAAFWSLLSFEVFLDALDAAASSDILRAKARYRLGLVLFLVAMGAKASALTIPLLLFIAWLSSRPHKRARLWQEGAGVFLLVFFDILLAYLNLERKESGYGDPIRIATNLVASLAHLVWPFTSAGALDPLRQGRVPPLGALFRVALIGAAAAAVVGLTIASARRRRSKRKVLAAWPYAAIAPYLPLTGTNPRYLYLATAGAAGCLMLALERRWERRPVATTAAVLLLVAAAAAYDRHMAGPFREEGEECRTVIEMFAPYEAHLRAGVPVFVHALPGINDRGVWTWGGRGTLQDALRLRYGSTSPVWDAPAAGPAHDGPYLYLDYPRLHLRYEPPPLVRYAYPGPAPESPASVIPNA